MKSANGVSPSLTFLLILAIVINYNGASFVSQEANGSASVAAKSEEMVPLMEEKLLMVNETRRRLGSFQICALCTCCGGAKGVCLASPCCYAINCNIPNRPFGFCSFTPKTCNCFGCHL